MRDEDVWGAVRKVERWEMRDENGSGDGGLWERLRDEDGGSENG
jgi:hypothetical protein